jgi:hypothetical protein
MLDQSLGRQHKLLAFWTDYGRLPNAAADSGDLSVDFRSNASFAHGRDHRSTRARRCDHIDETARCVLEFSLSKFSTFALDA